MAEGASQERTFRITLAQLDFTVGDIAGNTARIVETIAGAKELGSDLVVFPELAVCGYPPEDLLLRPSFLAANQEAVDAIAAGTDGITAVVGFAHREAGELYNAAVVLHDGRLCHAHHKAHLPNYSVFDERRYFRAGTRPAVLQRGDTRLAVNVCEDIWVPIGPPQRQALAGAELLVNLSASPYSRGKAPRRERMLAVRAADNTAFVAFCNLVGGQDELVFDGCSAVLGPDGSVVARAASCAEEILTIDLEMEAVFRSRLLDPRLRGAPVPDRPGRAVEIVELPALPPARRPTLPSRRPAREMEDLAEVYGALVLGLRDYVCKNGFGDVVLGLSGGIDSALSAAVAVDALGAGHVVGVAMPSRYSSDSSLTDARESARLLGARLLEIPIDGPFQTFLEALGPQLAGRPPDTTEENLQPRVRGNILMALSNRYGWLVLANSNKSESSVGYVTLYGDSAGGFAPLRDVPKTLVYGLAGWRNAQPDGPRIPEHSITRPPSAELRPGQLDLDSLPPYDVLDPILEAYVEEERGVAEIVGMGFERDVVERVARMVDQAEYKRRQSPPGIRITDRAFGRDRRMPITNHWSKARRAGP